MKIDCIIVDDEPVARKLLEEYIGDIDFLQLVGKAEHPLKAHNLLSTQHVDLMFLDVNMPKMNGINFLRSSTSLPLTIMTTAYAEYAIEGFELDVLDYLVKPFSFERFFKACNKAKEYIELQQRSNVSAPQQTPNFFFVKCDGRIEKILYDELVYVEAMLNYVVLHTDTRKLIVYLTIKGVMEQLPSEFFLKIHKSTIVNINKIKSIEGNEINMGKAKVVISQTLQDGIMKEILKDRMMKR
ncbi:MAG: LytTR family DNA-binding domain-containing protein [Flavipsychrobacter sp.]|nr:LytTR family DNA-binding domain-containing protein [Flavipsychrobacter sp.]